MGILLRNKRNPLLRALLREEFPTFRRTRSVRSISRNMDLRTDKFSGRWSSRKQKMRSGEEEARGRKDKPMAIRCAQEKSKEPGSGNWETQSRYKKRKQKSETTLANECVDLGERTAQQERRKRNKSSPRIPRQGKHGQQRKRQRTAYRGERRNGCAQRNHRNYQIQQNRPIQKRDRQGIAKKGTNESVH